MRAAPILLAAALLARRPIQFSDVPPDFQTYVGAADRAAFDDLRRKIERDTLDRKRLGEEEHLIYFLLQSGVFTKRPRIEPAASAREFVDGGMATPPAEARGRMEDFLKALRGPGSDERLSYWKSHLENERRTMAELSAAYGRAMRFLYQKEFGSGDGDSSRLYQRR